MNSWIKHPLRITSRLLALGREVFLAALNYMIYCAACPRNSLLKARTSWLQNVSRRLLRIFRIELQLTGALPSNGLLVCNHLSYLDIFVLSALAPCVFVAKREVKYWPVFGGFAKLAGTVFVHREHRSQTSRTVEEIEAALQKGALVVLFPEGTSSGGETVRPFKSSLLEPVTQRNYSLTAGLLRYEISDGDASEEVCYWRDMTLIPHLINLFSKRSIQVSVHFEHLHQDNSDRKQLARRLHEKVLRMKQAIAI